MQHIVSLSLSATYIAEGVRRVSNAVQVMGKDNVVGLLKRLRPKVFLPLVNAEFDSEGPLSSLISEKGSVAGLPDVLKAEGLGEIAVVVPKAGERTGIDC